ncbi:MAG: DHH family phosphoesterase, partial [Clostridia bacterium]|nr:DHH family phosphoesterase [Clostridia bacterium]
TALGRWYLSAAEFVLYLCAVIFSMVASKKLPVVLAPYYETSSVKTDSAVNDTLLEMPAPITLVKVETGELVWCNTQFLELTGCPKNYFQLHIKDVVPGFDLKWIIDGKVQKPDREVVGQRSFDIYSSIVRPGKGDYTNLFAALYWIERTGEIALQAELENHRLVVGEIVCDNYEEISLGGNESARAAMVAQLDALLREWFEGLEVEYLLRSTDRDRYVFFTDEKSAKKLSETRFDILEKAKAIKAPNGMPLTVSIGMSREATEIGEAERFSTLALDMALSRGGDQAVIKSRKDFEFYGGMTHEKEKHTKVKSRIMANVLKGLITDCTDVYAMGHRIADLDSLGGTAGIVCAARKLGKNAKIIVDRNLNNAGMLIELLEQAPEYRDVFISPEEALIRIKPGSLLVVVDTNRSNYVEDKDLLSAFSKIAVIDHHRRVADYIDNAVLNIHEPTASSVCELIAEILSYMLDSGDMFRVEASAMLAGIILDTKSFALKTGVRTFEAAAYLRRNGADSIEIKKMFQNDMENYVQRAEIVKKAVFMDGMYAISCSDVTVDRAVAAQAADDLMNIMGVAGSFVLFPFENTVSISARSLGRINVQLIMEKLGGGGHFTTAGAQIKNKTMEEVASMLRDAISIYQYEQR